VTDVADGLRRTAPMVWLGQSARTTVVTRAYPELAGERWLASLGDAVHRPRMAETVFKGGLKERLYVTGPVMLDSGGFTMMSRSSDLGVEHVLGIYRESAADVLISLDHPPLATDPEDVRRSKYWKTISNYAFLLDNLGSDRLAPVLHGVTIEELAANCGVLSRLNRSPAWVCVGGLVPLLRRSGALGRRGQDARESLTRSISLVRASFPASNLHVLGAGAPGTIAMAFRCGADSVDSVGWRRAAGFGTIFLPGGSERIVSDRDRKRPASRPGLEPADMLMLASCECPACSRAGALDGRLQCLSASYLARAAHNAHILLEQARGLAGGRPPPRRPAPETR
jgi:tRNA-guanine family transglycosylase